MHMRCRCALPPLADADSACGSAGLVHAFPHSRLHPRPAHLQESIARTRLMLNCFQGVKGVMVCGKLMDGLQADGQRPRFNLHPKVKAAAYKVGSCRVGWEVRS